MGLKAGCARVDITPPLGTALAGYFHPRIAKRVRDGLSANAVVLDGGGEALALVSLDLAHVGASVTDPARRLIEAGTGIPADRVLIAATHTHTGPEACGGEPMPVDPSYVASLPGLIAGAVGKAAGSLFPASLRHGTTEVHGLSFNRLRRRIDGSEVFGAPDAPGVIGPAGTADPLLQTLSLVDGDGNLRALAVNFALHPDVIGGADADFLSADWPGVLAETVRAVYGRDAVTLFLQGAAGDINHVSHDPREPERSREGKALQLGRAIAGAAMYAAERAAPLEETALRAATEVLPIPYCIRDGAIRAEAEALRARGERSYFDDAFLRAVDSWPHDGQVRDVPVQALRIGSVGLAAFPAEVFSGIGREVRRLSPFPATWIAELANDRASVYIPTAEQAERGAYGARPILSRRLSKEAGRLVGDAAVRLLHRLA